jgi:argininosuccinate synthase
MKKKVVLAYSGGLDTSVILKWLEEKYDYEVIAVCVDVGQKDNYQAVKAKALATGATKAYVVDAKDVFVKDYLFKGIKMGAIYEDDYLLGTAFARPLIAKHLVEIALKEGAEAIAHGATGKGNDQVRFEAGIKAMAPHLKVIAPWREWDLKSREDCIDYALAHNIPIPVTKKDIYSRDENLWHISHEGGNLEDPWEAHETGVYKWCVPAEQSPETASVLTLSFEKGEPVAINGEKMTPVALLTKLNELGGMHGVGIKDIVENRLVGMKSRGVYETPGGTILYEAHKALEKLTLDRQTMAFKKQVSLKYAELVYDGLWMTPLREAMDLFSESINQVVTGEVEIKLYKGMCTTIGSKSPYSLYNEAYVTFGEDEVYNQKDAAGFIQLFTLPLTLRAMMKIDLENQEMLTEKVGS